MTEDDPTKDLTDEMSDRQILLELRQTMTAMSERLTRLEARFDGRDTNPLLPPNFAERFNALEKDIKEVKRSFKILHGDVLQVRQEHAALEERMDTLEQRPN